MTGEAIAPRRRPAGGHESALRPNPSPLIPGGGGTSQAVESFDPAQHYAARYPAHVVCVRVIREEIAAIAVECGFDDTGVSDVRLAVSEIASNAVVHGYDC